MAIRHRRSEVIGVDPCSCVGMAPSLLTSPLDTQYFELSRAESARQVKLAAFKYPEIRGRHRVSETLFLSKTCPGSGFYWRVIRQRTSGAGRVVYMRARAPTEEEKAEEKRNQDLKKALRTAPDAVKEAWILLPLTAIPTLLDGLSCADRAKLRMGTDLYDLAKQQFVKLDPSTSAIV